MEKKFEYGEQVYLAVTVNEVGPGNGYDYTVAWKDHVDRAACMTSVGEEQLFTAQEIADQCSKDPIDWQATYNEYSEKAQRTIAGLSKRITELDETIRAFSESENIVRTNFTAKCDEIMVLKSENERLSSKNDELETTVSELSVLVDKLRKEMAHREELWGNVSNNNDIAKVNLNRLCKQREILTDRIIALEAELEAERKKNYG